MSSVDLPAAAVTGPALTAIARPARRSPRSLRLIGGFILTGIFLALSAAVFPLAAVYSFIWWAKLY